MRFIGVLVVYPPRFFGSPFQSTVGGRSFDNSYGEGGSLEHAPFPRVHEPLVLLAQSFFGAAMAAPMVMAAPNASPDIFFILSKSTFFSSSFAAPL